MQKFICRFPGELARIVVIAALLVFTATNASGAILETFEDEADGATSFTTGSTTFNTTGELRVFSFAPFGNNSSTFFLDTGFGQSVTSVGSIDIVGANRSFVLSSMYLWTSPDGGDTDIDANVEITGTLLGGGSVSDTFFIDPTGIFGTDWFFLGLTGTVFDSANLTSVSFVNQSPANYLAVDDLLLDIRISAIPIPAAVWLFGTALIGLVGLSKRRNSV